MTTPRIILCIFVALGDLLYGQTPQWYPIGTNTLYAPAGVNVGIGTMSPTASLDNAGTRTALGADSSGWHWFETNTGTSEPNRVAFGFNATSGTVNTLGFFTNGAWRMYVGTNGNVGIGTMTPHATLEVKSDTGISISGSNYDDAYRLKRDGPSGNLDFIGSQATYSGYRFFVNGTAQALQISNNGNVGIGTTAPPYPLSVKGTIGAGEVIVTSTSGWPDYVFAPDYRLTPLNEVVAYIKENHHLPGIPSEAEVKEKGVSLGEMQSKLLAKIEELTLHMIQTQETSSRVARQNDDLARMNKQLEERTRQLQERVDQLELRK